MATEPPIQPFDEPGLKAALRRTHAAETAPAGLRDRITAALAAAAAAESAAGLGAAHSDVAGRIGRSGGRMRIAASFIALLGVGLLGYTLYNEYGGHLSRKTSVVGLPVGLTHQMVERHDAAFADASLVNQNPKDDLAAIGNRLTAQLGKPVASMNLGDGWTVKGATIASVGKYQAAQILFQRGASTISMLSIPITEGYSPPDGQRYDEKDGDHLIAGVVQGQTVYCLIGLPKDGKPSAKELKQLREKLADHVRTFLPPNSCAPPSDQTNGARPS